MKVLLDANTPNPLVRYLRGHSVTCAQDLGWLTLGNGSLLDAAEKAGFEIVVSCDQNLRYQQNFTTRDLAVVLLSTRACSHYSQSFDNEREG